MKKSIKNILPAAFLILFFLIICTVFVITGCDNNQTGANNTATTETELMKSNTFSDIDIDNVQSLEITKIGVDGKVSEVINDHDQIVKKYNYLNSFKIGDKTDRCVEDNTTIYKFSQNDKVVSINIEGGDILVLDKERYELLKK